MSDDLRFVAITILLAFLLIVTALLSSEAHRRATWNDCVVITKDKSAAEILAVCGRL